MTECLMLPLKLAGHQKYFRDWMSNHEIHKTIVPQKLELYGTLCTATCDFTSIDNNKTT